jgi:3-methyladenine DNA glycosylase/8-oxoguanine DNA glycosylase
VEPALTIIDEKMAHQLYSSVEEKVRRAVELENHLEAISDNISATELTTARFRIRQLTGLDELEQWLLSL